MSKCDVFSSETLFVSSRLSDILQLDEVDVNDSPPRQQDSIMTRRQESVTL